MAVKAEVIKTITFHAGNVSGQAIIDAVKKIAGEEYIETLKIVDDKKLALIGRGSKSPYADLAISVNRDHSVGHIDPSEAYGFIAVVHHEWLVGMKNAVVYHADRINRSMEEFRDKLVEELAAS